MDAVPPQVAIFVSSALLLLIVRAEEVQILFKSKSQRTKRESSRVERGLRRSLMLELAVFVPASAALVLMIAPLAIPESAFEDAKSSIAIYSVLGIASYGFPFAAIRVAVTRIALNTLKEFASIAPVAQTAPEEE